MNREDFLGKPWLYPENWVLVKSDGEFGYVIMDVIRSMYLLIEDDELARDTIRQMLAHGATVYETHEQFRVAVEANKPKRRPPVLAFQGRFIHDATWEEFKRYQRGDISWIDEKRI
jgi:hypothetical protein